VLVDVAVMLADGGEAIADIDVLRHQAQVLGPVASAPTVWRALDEATPARLRKIDVARARVRRHVWAQLPDGVPASKVAGTDLGEVVVLDVDATIVVAHSEKEHAAPTFKGTFGFHPLGVWCDNTTELLAAGLRAGNAGANTAADHIEVLTAAIAQIPATHRKNLLIRADGAGASHALLDWLTALNQIRGRRVDYSVGFAVTEKLRQAITLVPTKVWTPALDADGGVRAGGDVVELTGLLELSGWPPGMRVIVRRERPHPGAQLSLFEQADGWRYQAIATNTATGQLAFLEARHRAHARVEDRIRHAKDTGLGRFPSREFAVNQAWLTATAIAADLIAWLRLLALPDRLVNAEPKALRYRLLHVPARLTHSGRRRHLRIPATWPWVDDVVAVFARIAAIPLPA
jgi:Transposase DDE domain group 1